MDAVTARPRGRWRDFRGVLRPAGAVIIGLGLAQLACALIGGALEWWTLPASERDPSDALGLVIGSVATGAVGLGAYVYGRRHASPSLTRREAVLTVSVIWLAAGVCSAVPFVITSGLSPSDALFESVSGLTTTGATVIDDIDHRLSMPILLWRSLIQWLGGMGIVVLFVAIFPSVGAGAKHMFKGEMTGMTSEGLKPRIAETSFTLWKLYATFTTTVAVLLMLLGMSPFEAVCHSLTTMSTAGFSTRDTSIGAFDSAAIDVVLATFMILGSVNYALYYALLRGRSIRVVLRNTELRAFFALCAVLVVVLTIGILPLHDHDPVTSFRFAYFRVATTISSTGYSIDDYSEYPAPMLMLVVFMMFVGGCAGSTAGGVKVERVVLMAKTAWAEFRESFRPSVVHVVRMGRAAVPEEVVRDVAVLVAVYVMCLGAGIFVVSLTDGISLPTAFGAMLSCLSNMGPAPFHQGADNFTTYSAPAKVFFSVAMVVGRLEFFTVFALLVPDFWRR